MPKDRELTQDAPALPAQKGAHAVPKRPKRPRGVAGWERKKEPDFEFLWGAGKRHFHFSCDSG